MLNKFREYWALPKIGLSRIIPQVIQTPVNGRDYFKVYG